MTSKKSIIKRINRGNEKLYANVANTDNIKRNKIVDQAVDDENNDQADDQAVDQAVDDDQDNDQDDENNDQDNENNDQDNENNDQADDDDQVVDESTGTLDPVEEEKLFYFKSVGSDKIHCITQNQARLSSVFGNMIDSDTYDEKSVISFKVITETYDVEENSTAIYNLNTDEMFDIIVEYLNIWKKTPGTSSYIKLEHIQTSDPLQVLKKKDVEFIESYIKKIIDQNNENTSEQNNENTSKQNIKSIKIVFDKHQYDTSHVYHKIINNKILSGLLAQADYLDIQCLFNKITVYIACIIWSISIHDIYELSKNKYFQQLAASAIKQAGIKLNNYVTSITAGDGKDDNIEDIQDKNNDQVDNKTLDTTTNIYNTENCKLLDDSHYEVFDEDQSSDESD